MMMAMGQGQTQVSPYHMALITAAVANGGTLMKPYLVDSVTNYKGAEMSKNKPSKYGELMTAQEASVLKSYMQRCGGLRNGIRSFWVSLIRRQERQELRSIVLIKRKTIPGL